jgi:apolipoprotein N-acyltransferase
VNLRDFVERRFAGSAVAFVAGALLACSIAPLSLWPLAFLMPAVLFWLWEGARPKRAAVLGFWFNVGTFAVGTYWLYIAIEQIGGAPLWLTVILMAGLLAIMGAYFYVMGWLVARFLPERGWLRWIVGLPAAWMFVEWWRSWFLSGFGWLALGYSQTDSWFAGFAPVAGQFGMGYLVALVAGALLTLLLGSRNERIAACVIVVATFGAGRVLLDREWVSPSGGPLTVAVIQGAIPQDEKWIEDNLPKTRELYAKLTREAHGAKLIVWPESAIPDIANNYIDFLGGVYKDASAHGSALVLGAMREADNQRTGQQEYFNSIIAMDRNVEGIGFYDKHHLVPFTEFVPVPNFVRNWLRLMNLPNADFTRGPVERPVLHAAGQRIAAGICYEDAYGGTQLPALNTATMLVNVTNDAWFGHSTARYQHLQISRLRAMEARRPMVRAANTGVSALIDERGRVVKTAPEYEPNVMRGEIQPQIGLTPYARMGNGPVICWALVLCFGSAYLARRPKSS